MNIKWTEEEVKLQDLKEYDKNPRYINKEDFQRLVESLKQDGYHQRLLVDYDNTIIGGHQRLKAFKEAGFKNKDLIKILKPERKLTDEEFRRINIRDNLNNGSWDFNILSNEWDIPELVDLGFPEYLLDNVTNITLNEIKNNINTTDTNQSVENDLDPTRHKLDVYQNNTIKQIVLYYENKQYEDVLIKLDAIADLYQLNDNSETVVKLIEFWEIHHDSNNNTNKK